MKNNQLNNRYSIEYVHPGATGHSNSSKKGLIITILTLIALAVLGAFLWKQGYINQFLQSNNSVSSNEDITQAPKELKVSSTTDYSDRTGKQIFLDKCSYCHGKKGEGNLKDTYPKLQGQRSAYILLQLKRMKNGERLNVNPSMFAIIKKMDIKTFEKIAKHISSIPSPSSDKKLINQLDVLSNQLHLEKKKNLALSDQIKKSQETSNNLSKLYENSINKMKDSDKGFMKVLQQEEKRVANTTDPKKKESVTITESDASTITANTNLSRKDTYLELSTSNQMDKIVQALGKTEPTSKAISNKRVYVEIDSNVVKKSVGIQNKIDQLVSDKIVPETKFTKALKTEKKIRKNSVRSVVVKKGETLWSIAKRAYGNGFAYPKILKANPNIKNGKIVKLYIGQVIRVPK